MPDNSLGVLGDRQADVVVGGGVAQGVVLEGLWQEINGSGTWTDYSSVAAAYAMLNDADGDSTTNVNGAKQFDGEVLAVV